MAHKSCRKAAALLLAFTLIITGCTSKGIKYCESGDYAAAIEYYEERFEDGKITDDEKDILNALKAYDETIAAVALFDIEKAEAGIRILDETVCDYPTEEERSAVKKSVEALRADIDAADEKIAAAEAALASHDALAAAFASEEDITALASCGITDEQKTKAQQIAAIVTAYITAVNAYNSGDYTTASETLAAMPDCSAYGIYANVTELAAASESAATVINTMAEIKTCMDAGDYSGADVLIASLSGATLTTEQVAELSGYAAIITERANIDAIMAEARQGITDRDYAAALDAANQLLPLNLTDEERAEAENIIQVSTEQLEAQAAAEAAAAEAAAITAAAEARVSASENSSSQSSASTAKTTDTVYWTESGEVYHSTPNCSALSRSKNIKSGTIAQSGKSRACKLCF